MIDLTTLRTPIVLNGCETRSLAKMLELSDRLKSCTISNADLTTEILLAWRKGRLPAEIQDFLNLWEEDLTYPNENTTAL